MRARKSGLTLVELMVAVGLGSILIGVITFVWMQSNKIFTSTLNRMEAYQRLRIVLDVMERDLANTNRTVDMEFFTDANASGHFDDGTSDALMGGGAPGFRAPIDNADPLRIASKPEFEDGDAWNGGINAHPFFHAPLVFSPSPYEITQDDYLTTRSYWRDEVYVRTFAMADGINRPAMVHYRLVPEADGRMALRRRMWFLNEQGLLVPPPNANATDRFAVLSTGMCDLKVGFYFKENASSTVGSSQPNGWWYHVGLHGSDTNAQHVALEEADTKAGFVSALRGSPLPSAQGPTVPPLSAQHVGRAQFTTGTTGGPQWNAVTFFYKGFMRVSLVEGKALLSPVSNLTVAYNDAAAVQPFDFPGVRPGDRVFLSKATDDDGDFWGTTQAASSVTGPNPFPDQLFTVESILSNWNTTYVAIKVEEPMSFPRLVRRWLKVETPTSFLPFDQGRPAGVRTQEGSFNAEYRVGFLPAAFRVRMSMDDKYNKKVLPMERVIRLIQQ